jgi:hypothetical protein
MSHSHSHAADVVNARLGLSIILTLTVVVGEADGWLGSGFGPP